MPDYAVLDGRDVVDVAEAPDGEAAYRAFLRRPDRRDGWGFIPMQSLLHSRRRRRWRQQALALLQTRDRA